MKVKQHKNVVLKLTGYVNVVSTLYLLGTHSVHKHSPIYMYDDDDDDNNCFKSFQQYFVCVAFYGPVKP